MIEQENSTESLIQFRNNALIFLSFIVVPLILPFAIYYFSIGNLVIGVNSIVIVALLTINSFFIKYNNESFPYFNIIFFTFNTTHLAIAILYLQVNALFWCYPALFILVFIMELKMARIMMLIGLGVFISCAFYSVGHELAIRFAFTISFSCCFSDVLFGRIQKLQAMLTEIAIRDPLTNTYNRRHLDQYLHDAIEEYGRGFGAVSLILLDIDGFKKINDKHGHEAGDQILKNLSNLLSERLRKLDYIFRIGGDEFLVLLRNTNEQQATLSAESFRKYVEENKLLEDENITISLGVVEYKKDETIDEWINRADKNLYKAKEAGRNKVFSLS